MTDPRGPGWTDPAQGAGGYPPNTDPAYAGYWGPTAQYPAAGAPGYGYPPTQPTEQLPPYWQPGTGYPGAPPPPEPPRKTSKWLWAAAVAAVLLVTGLVLALVIVSNSSRETTIVAPPTSQTPTSTLPSPTSRPPSPTTIRPPSGTVVPAPLPIPTQTFEPTEPDTAPAPAPAGTESVVYSVSGQGRAINITYVDTGGIMQTEFNVVLPWSKEVALAAPARTSASVAVVNIGRDVTCSVSVNGALVRQRSGRGLTVCTGAG